LGATGIRQKRAAQRVCGSRQAAFRRQVMLGCTGPDWRSNRRQDGDPAAVRAYLRHFWNHWSGPRYAIAKSRLDHLTRVYSPPGSFTASIMWYRSSGNPVTAYAHEQTPAADDRLSTPTRVLWQEHDPIFPLAWGDRLGDFFTAHRFDRLAGVGHFTPLEATDTFAAAIRDFLTA
jgi:pimeloyl-ACP methyl ester carboxylesterase